MQGFLHRALGGRGPEAGQAFEARRQQDENLAGHFADDGLAKELLPPTLRLTIAYDEVRVGQPSRDAEIKDPAVEAAIEDHAQIAQWTSMSPRQGSCPKCHCRFCDTGGHAKDRHG